MEQATSPVAALPIRVDPGSSVPIAVQLRDQLAWLIAVRSLAPGDRLPPIRALAAQVGVHHHTIRAAYKQLEADGLVSIGHGVGATVRPFTSLQLARPTIGRLAGSIGILVAGFDPFYMPFLRGIEAVADRIRALTIICVTEDSPVKAKVQIDQLVARGVGGIIAASVGRLVQDQLQPSGTAQPVPVVYCDQPDLGGQAIVFDADGAGFEAAAHLGDHGHDRLVLLTAPVDWPNMAALYRGYRRAATEGRIGGVEALVVDAFTVEAGAAAARRVLEGPGRPTAIAAAADVLAIGALLAARELGLRVPEDLAVVGYGDIEIARLLDPPLATVSTPTLEMGRLAAERLDRLMRGESLRAQTTILPTRFMARRSCGCVDSVG
jgi:DNA-binding LacI/PurR family transcriptional regulator